MNVNDDSNINKVRSKYFTREHMDDSLTDFQERKKINTGPKISKVISKKPKKASKRIKGQKDIRSALKEKKDELVACTKKFDLICRKSGIDVDPEHLELAIALSKSLDSEPLNSGTVKTAISTQEKSKRIRNTLQEYGFKVGKTKIVRKKSKKTHNNYKLLSCANAEGLQVISDKFAQVLLKNVHNFKTNSVIDFSITPLYYISTNISYEEVKNNEIFYVDGLIEKSKSTGSLLRNWADIPGRPLSPINVNYFEMNSIEIECSQDELDLALSGSLQSIKNIQFKQNGNTDSNIYTSDPNNKFKNISHDKCLTIEIPNKAKIEVENQSLQHKYRSCSPDIFEDEIASTPANDKNNVTISKDKITYDMDLTECISVNTDLVPRIVDTKVDCHIVNNCNISKEKSDVIEINDGIDSTSISNNQFIHNHVIDLTQSSNNKEFTPIEKINENCDIDLTQSSNSSDELPIVHLPDNHPLDDTVIINVCEYENIINTRNIRKTADKQEILDLTQDCKTTELNKENSSPRGFFEDYVYGHSDHSEEYLANNNMYTDKKDNTNNERKIDEKIDFNRSEDSSKELSDNRVHDSLYKKTFLSSADNSDNKDNDKTSSELNDFDIINLTCVTTGDNNTDAIINLDEIDRCKEADTADSSDSRQVPVENEKFKNNSCKIQSLYSSNFHNDTIEIEDEIDLTQQSFVIYGAVNTRSRKLHNSSLGEKQNVSVDNNEVSNENDYERPINGVSSSNSVVYEIPDEFDKVDNVIKRSESNDVLVSSQSSEVFEIIDNELNYSLFQSKHEHLNTEDLSAENNLSSTEKCYDVVDLDHKDEIPGGHSNDLEYLPDIDLKGTQEETVITSISNGTVNLLESPKSNKVIIKTDKVTPMKDYASMSTPERNKELDKYGIKPFKRKRAIQLLTHIYNQTHPIIDNNTDCIQPSPKKPKLHTPPRNSPKTLNLPKEISKENIVNNENVYEVTNEVPIIRKLECPVEDWVFQKREKAKVHSCRVPLHVAFHNYISCRRGLREAILRYEPVNIDVIHKQLVGYGHRYDPKDLLKFMDKKCITVKTTDNNGRNNKNRM